jgi:nucleotide-binding universal stress UspA family protein
MYHMAERHLITKILVPIDTSEVAERAIPWAKTLAGATAEIVLMEVIPQASDVRTFCGQVIGKAETIQAGYQQMAEDQLASAVAKWFEPDDRVHTVVAVGDPGDQILSVAAEHGADLIVMSSHGRGSIGRFISGSVADRVVRQAPVPVMIIGPEGESATQASIGRIVVPVDASELSLAALPVAGALALSTGAPLEVIHVVVPPTDFSMTYAAAAGSIPPLPVDVQYEQLAEAGETLVAKAIERLKDQGVDARGTVFTGSPTGVILDELESGDIVVLSSHQRQGLERWVLGSTSMKLIRNGQAPVVIVTRESIERSSAS